MRIVALIPARGGSKGIPLKNIREFCGRPLVYWTLDAANQCPSIDEVYVSTDSRVIAECVNEYGSTKVQPIFRDPATATDEASTAAVMVDFSERIDYDLLVVIQATSPFLKAGDLMKGITKYFAGSYDSVISVVRQKRFIWEPSGWFVTPVGHPLLTRPRRQEWQGFLVENGAFIIRSRKNFIETKARLAGHVGMIEMDEDSYMEIDEEADWVMLEALMKWRLSYAEAAIK
jgi:CMP-N-acetylneuraminic acid synthetase